MRICPHCQKQFDDTLNYCLDDGFTLIDANRHDPQRTLSYGADPTIRVNQTRVTQDERFSVDPRQNINYGAQYRRKGRPQIFLVVAAIAGLLGVTLAGIVGLFLFNRRGGKEGIRYPTTTPVRTPPRTPTPEKAEELKVEILDKVKDGMGQSHLKVMITNTGENIVPMPFVKVSFFKKDVKIKDVSGKSELPFLKPQQSVPVWLNLYGTDNYTSVKIDGPVTARAATKTAAQIYPKLNFTETEMKAEKAGLLYNFRQLYKIYYKVGGIVESDNQENISPRLYVLYYDDKSQIVGIEAANLTGLKKGEKTKFEASVCEIDLFGVPKTFEIIAVDD